MNLKLLSKSLSLFLFLFFSFLFLFFLNHNAAQSAETQSFSSLDPASAFRFSVTERPGKIDVHYSIAEGYYLYRERFAFSVKESNARRNAAGNATLGAAVLPAGQQKFDRTFQKTVEIYRHHLTVQIPVIDARAPFDLVVTSQGCADQGICYPPMKRVVRISGAALSAPHNLGKDLGKDPSGGTHGLTIFHKWYRYSASYAQSVLQGQGFFAALAIFWGLGIALSLLPCSLPMVPILSAIIIGERKSENSAVAVPAVASRRRAVLLSLMYVLGMSVSYAVTGVVAALVGQSLGFWLQNAWVVSLFACFLLIFALSMLGCYRLPILSWQPRPLNGMQPQQLTRRWLTAFTMGALSALMVGACMTAPLFGVLTFIAQTGDFILGAAALFFIAWGIGTPLLLMGAGVGSWLPRAGAWMEGLERLLGLLLAATALWLVLPILPTAVMMLLCAFWLLMAASVLYISTPPLTTVAATAVLGWALVGKVTSAMGALFALMLIIGAAAGSNRLLTPLAVFTATEKTVKTVKTLKNEALAENVEKSSKNSDQQAKVSDIFSPVKTVEDVRQAVEASKKPTLLDFYAQWCVSCREMENLTLADSRVRATLSRWNLLRADVTANDADDRALLKYFRLYGPPAVLFFDARGNEILPLRTVGYQPPEVFLKTLDRLRLADELDSR